MSKVFLFLFSVSFFIAGAQVTSPESAFGFRPGADYKLARYDMMLDYYSRLAEGSPRVLYKEIGKSVLGRPMIILVISSEENLAGLEKYRGYAEKLARARTSDQEAREMSKQGKAVVWIDGGLHATEVAGAQMTPELAYRVATEETEEMRNIRENVILVLMPVMNPDGLDIVADWYQRNLGTPFETSRPPWLYHHFVGHDNNRDWFMNNMPESYHVNDQVYRVWYPQIVYNHHQTAPAWARIFIPPFADPVNPRIHPGTTTATNLLGTAMGNRFAMDNMPGAVSTTTYSMWWNGGMRTVPYFHNMVGILTETAHATPTPRYYPEESLPSTVGGARGGLSTDGTQVFYSSPWKGGESRFRDAIDYMITGSMAVLDFAADRKEEYLYNIYRMGRDAINGTYLGENFTYVLSADQAENGEVADLVNILLHGGVEVKKARRSFRADGRDFPEGSYIVSTEQAFRPYLEDLMETQQYPDKFLYPGGPPTSPYDLAGWTLPLQMGVEVVRVKEDLNVKTDDVVQLTAPEGWIGKGAGSHYLLPGNSNVSYKAVNMLLSQGISVLRLTESDGLAEAGDFIVASGAENLPEIAESTGARFESMNISGNHTNKLIRPKVGIYKSWIANMDEGWTRWLLDEYEFDWDTLHNNDIREGDISKYSAIIFPNQSASSILHGHPEGTMPHEFTGGIGSEGIRKLDEYMNSGGRIITFDGAGDLFIEQFGLPVRNVTRGQSTEEFFVPGSLLRVKVNSYDLTWGMPEEVAVSFDRSGAYRIQSPESYHEGGEERTVEKIALPAVDQIVNYPEKDILLSGWAMGEESVLGGSAGMVRLDRGKGDIIMFGFRPQFRGQPRATYKLLFNSILNIR